MTGHNRGQYSAAPSALGYFYQCRFALLEALRRLPEGERVCIGIETLADPEITVQNIVASADLQAVLNLNAIAIGLGLENIEYEPEQFPGLVYRIDDPKVVVLIFSSGKLVVTGGKSPENCEQGVEVVRQQLDSMGLL